MATGGAPIRCVGWDWAERCLNMGLTAGTQVDVAYRIRENDHPEYGGLELTLCDFTRTKPANQENVNSARAT